MKKTSTSTPQTLVIIRHAHRDTSLGSSLNNGLSEKGVLQAKRIKKYYLEHFEDYSPKVLSSPKQRCVETVKRLAKAAEVEVQTTPLLDEGGDLLSKTEQMIEEIRAMPEDLVVLCSHGDVIPVLVHRLVGSEVLLEKGGWIQLERIGGRYFLQWVLQDISKVS